MATNINREPINDAVMPPNSTDKIIGTLLLAKIATVYPPIPKNAAPAKLVKPA